MLTQVTFQAEISQITVAVFSSMLNRDVWSVFSNQQLELPFELEAEVKISGTWNGSLYLRCSAEQARQWALDLLSIEPDQENILDTLAEIGNMVGGNVKAILPPKNQLGVPVVRVIGGISTLAVPLENTTVVQFDSSHGPFSIALTENKLLSIKS